MQAGCNLSCSKLTCAAWLLQGSVSDAAAAALELQVSVFGMSTVCKDLSDFLEDRYLTGPASVQLREEFYKVPKMSSARCFAQRAVP